MFDAWNAKTTGFPTKEYYNTRLSSGDEVGVGEQVCTSNYMLGPAAL